ncbi:GAF domain-containing protein [Congregibacter sp.]|uniref:GAF domain-containing protein n=1 Tax=Congregibacter sp. TaxID=2744308 RepID=UPI003863EB9F
MNEVAKPGAAIKTEPRLSVSEARQQLAGLLSGEYDLVANAANTSAFLNTLLPDINWLGFYFLKDDELVLGPFQGNPACVRIPVGRGVCGTCVASGETQRVDDVHAFPGHIACDIRSRSELVIPIRADGEVIAVLDIDSPSTGRFSEDDQSYVEALIDEFTLHQFVRAGR